MNRYTDEEKRFLNFLYEEKPVPYIDEKLINSIINKKLIDGEYNSLIRILNLLYDYAVIPCNIVDKLILEDNKECISVFLDFLHRQGEIYFLNDNDILILNNYLGVKDINIRLNNDYANIENFLFDQGVMHMCSYKLDPKTTEHSFVKNYVLLRLRLKVVENVGLFASYINHNDYRLSREERILKAIDYLNEYGFKIDRDASLNVEL